MVQDWVTTLLLAFGIAVGIIGVIAYLRLFRKEKAAAASHSRADAPLSVSLAKGASSSLNGEEIASELESTKD